jgi:hypothetical protein
LSQFPLSSDTLVDTLPYKTLFAPLLLRYRFNEAPTKGAITIKLQGVLN